MGRISIKKVMITALISLFLLVGLNSLYAFAAGSNFQPAYLNRYEVYTGGSSYMPNTSDFPLNQRGVSAIGFDTMYGTSKPFFNYKGEVPQSVAGEQYAKNLRTYNGTKIGNQERPWSSIEMTADDVVPTNSDPHIWAMTVSQSGGFLSLILSLIEGINWLLTALINLMISLKSINLVELLESLDASGSLSNQLSRIFIIDPETGSLSPILIFALIIFIFSLAGLALSIIKGRLSGRSLISELGCLLLSFAIAAMFFSGSNTLTMSRIGLDFMTSLSNSMVADSNPSVSVFQYSSGNESLDNASTQKAIIYKSYIDQIIAAQFGYTVDDLYIVQPDGNDGGFGSRTEVEDAIRKTFGDDYNINAFVVSTDTTGHNNVNNLGYWLWAANSSVAISDGTETVIKESGEKTYVESGTCDRMLYVVDFLANIRAAAEDSSNQAMVNKVDTIMNALTTPNYGVAIANITGVMIQRVALSFALICITIFTALGQVIVTFGSFCMVVMPALLLYKGTRSIAKGMMWSYLFGFIRYLLGSAIFNAIIIVVALLSEQGFVGIIVSAIICGILSKFGPNLIKQLNMYITQLSRGKELSAMNNIYHSVNNGFDKWSSKNRKRRNADALVLNENGEAERNGSVSERIQEGIKKGENPLANEAGINPFGEKRKQHNADLVDKYNKKKRANGSSDLGDAGETAGQSTRNMIQDTIDSSKPGVGLGETVIEDADLNDITEVEDGIGLNISENNGEGLSHNENADIRGRHLVDDGTDEFNGIPIDNLWDEDGLSDAIDTLENYNREQQQKQILSDEEKIKSEKREARTLKLKNAGLKTVNKVPLVGETLNRGLANKMAQPAKTKAELMEAIEKVVSESNGSMTLDEAFDIVKADVLSKTARTSRENRAAALNKAKDNINTEDIARMKQKIHLNREKRKEQEDIHEVAEWIRQNKKG